MTDVKKEEWILEKLEINFKRGSSYDNTKDRYEGAISFRNGKYDRFVFNFEEDVSNKFLDLTRDKIIETASELGEKLSNSLKTKHDV